MWGPISDRSMQLSKQLISLILIVNLSACSLNSSSDPQLLPENNMSTTGIGAATGAVLGAGVGMIIGSSSGSAGEGALLGALAGATAGGLIGSEFERQEEQQINSREILERHDEILDRQQRELEQLRHIAGDEPLAYNPPKQKTIARNVYNPEVMQEESLPVAQNNSARAMMAPAKKFPAPQPQLVEQESIDLEPKTEPVQRELYKPREEYAQAHVEGVPEREYINAPSRPSQRTQAAIAALKKEDSRPALGAVNPPIKAVKAAVVAPVAPAKKVVALNTAPAKIVEEKVEQKKVAVKEQKKAVEKQVAKKSDLAESEVAIAPPARKAITTQLAKVEVKKEVEKVAEETKKEVAKVEPVKETKKNIETAKNINLSSNDCKGAEIEASRARKASSDADKLFYFRRAIRKCPSSALYHLEIAKVFSGIGRKDDAEYELRQALSLDPSNVQAQDQLTLLQAGE